MPRKYADYPTPEVGQTWADNDPRANYNNARKIIAIQDGKAHLDGYPKTRVRLDRMRPTSGGYRLIRTADGRPYTHPDDRGH